ncbi:unnamed protein product [Auanema sp. JU1783]|nr:unnamed protein product [Auanema sp. JU1783]
MLRVKSEVLKVVAEANTYFNQLQISIVVVDVLQTMRSNLSLYMFQEYRKQRIQFLPPHDFAVLMAFKYPGGLAFVGGMCSDLSVMLCGFYPHEPRVMGSIFFHEVAHLVGVPHRPSNSTIYVPNCRCPEKSTDQPRKQSTSLLLLDDGQQLSSHIKQKSTDYDDDVPGCLRIPGFDHDCTTQLFVDVIFKNRCLRTSPMLNFRTKTSICGNGIREANEQCDCGLEKYCTDWNCIASECVYRVHPFWLWLFTLSFLFFSIALLFFVLRYRGYHLGDIKDKMLACFKHPKAKSCGFKDFNSKQIFSGSLANVQKVPPSPMDANSIIVLLDRPPRAATLHRPRVPPPPPPPPGLSLSEPSNTISPPKTTLCVDSGNAYEIPRSQRSSASPQDNISWKFEDFDSDDEYGSGMAYSSYRAESGIPTCPSYPPFSPINRVTVQYHGSRDTMETECRSSNASSSSAINGTSI